MKFVLPHQRDLITDVRQQIKDTPDYSFFLQSLLEGINAEIGNKIACNHQVMQEAVGSALRQIEGDQGDL